MNKLFFAYLLIGITVLCSSCRKALHAEIDAANTAVDSVKDTEAAVYVPELIAQVEDSLKSALVEIENQKFKLFPNYDNAAKTLVYVEKTSKQIGFKSAARKALLKQEIAANIAEVTALININKELSKIAPKGKEGKAALENTNSLLAVIETISFECKAAYDSGQYVDVICKIKAGKESAISLKAELESAIAKTSGHVNRNDSDFDGVPDNLDKCPAIFGAKDNNGCPTDNSGNLTSQDTALRKAQLGFSYYKVIPMEETRDFRVNVVIKGTRSDVKSNIRKAEKVELEYADLNDTSIICYIDNIDFYNKIKVTLEANANDFEISPIDPLLKDEQELDPILGNNWHWHVRAVSKIAHKATVVLKTEVTPSGKYRPTPKEVNIDIVISNPVPSKSWIEKTSNWFIESFDSIIKSVLAIIGTAIGAGLVRLAVKKKSSKGKSNSK